MVVNLFYEERGTVGSYTVKSRITISAMVIQPSGPILVVNRDCPCCESGGKQLPKLGGDVFAIFALCNS